MKAIIPLVILSIVASCSPVLSDDATYFQLQALQRQLAVQNQMQLDAQRAAQQSASRAAFEAQIQQMQRNTDQMFHEREMRRILESK